MSELATQDTSYLLRGVDLTEAEGALVRAGAGTQPHPTILQQEYVLTSRRGATRRQRITLGSVTFGLVVAGVLACLASLSSYRAETRRIGEVASRLDASALRRFSDAQADDLRQQIEVDRYRKVIRERDAIIGKDDPQGAARAAKALADEAAQYEARIRELRREARSLRELGERYLLEADGHWTAYERRWIGRTDAARTRPTMPRIFSVEVINSPRGECLIIHYGTLHEPRFVLIDGGLRRSYTSHIAPRLEELRYRWAGADPLKIDLAIVSQFDAERVEAMAALIGALVAQARRQIDLGTVWFNFHPPARPEYARYHVRRRAVTVDRTLGLPLKWQLPADLLALRTPVNHPFGNFVMRPDDGAIRVHWPGGLVITVLHPTPKHIAAFQKELLNLRRRYQIEPAFSEIVEPFAADGLDLIRPDRASLHRPMSEHGNDRSIYNNASMVLMFEYQGKRFLYTGDANDDQILDGLFQAGYLDLRGRAHVDILHIPHYGSDRNVTEEFFRRVIATNYLITGDGTHDNPEPETLRRLFAARRDEEFALQFAHRVGEATLSSRLDEVFAQSASEAPHSRRVFRPADENSLIVDLLEPVRY